MYSASSFLLDDTYITYQAAKHFATGHGLVFNVGERYLSTSAPLFALALGVLGIANPAAIPLLGAALSLVAMLAAAAGFLAIGYALNRPVWAYSAAVVYLALPTVWISVGFETTSQIALVVWAFNGYLGARQRGRPAYGAAILLALAACVRPDGVLAAGAVVLFACSQATYRFARHFSELRKGVQQEGRTLSLRAIGLYLAILLLFFGGIDLYFGSPLPGTMAAKVAQAQAGGLQLFAGGMMEWTRSLAHYDKAIYLVLLLACLGVFGMAKNAALRLILCFALLHLAAYQFAGIPFFSWYVIPESLAVAALAGEGVAIIVRSITLAGVARQAALSAVGVASMFLMWSSCTFARVYYGQNPIHSKSVSVSREWLYARVADWLKNNTQPTDRIGYYEVGEIGWLSDRRFVDPVGLVTPGQEDNIRHKARDAAYRQLGPEYVLCLQRQEPNHRWDSEYGIDPDNKAWFQACYRLAAEVDNTPFRVVIYKKQMDYDHWRKLTSNGLIPSEARLAG